MIKVRIWRDRCGNLEGRPTSYAWAEAFAKVVRDHMDRKDASLRDYLTFYIQGEDDAIRENVSDAAWKEIEKGYTATVLLDPWLVGHWYGYDAHCVAEGPLTKKGLPRKSRKTVTQTRACRVCKKAFTPIYAEGEQFIHLECRA